MERMCCANLPQFLAVKINSSHVSKTPPRPRQNRCSLDPSVTCTSYITSAPGGKMQPRLPPQSCLGRSGSAQPQMEPWLCAGNCRERSSPQRWDLLGWPVCCLPAVMDGSWDAPRAAQGSCLSSVRVEVRHPYQMSFHQVAVR